MKHDHSHEGEVSHKIEVPEGFKARIAQIKQHLQDNKATYLAGAGCLVAGYLLRKPQIIEIVNNNTPTIAPVMNNIVNNTVNNGGHMRKIIKCLETGELWLSVTEAAKAQGKNISLMSQHLNHPDVVSEINGQHFIIEALATH